MNHALVYRQKNKTSKVINHHNYRQSAEQNNAVKQLLTRHRIQPKLKISQPDDPLEREADEMADRVMETSDTQAAGKSIVQQAKPEKSTNNQDTTRLPGKLKNGIEFLSGYSMDDVKVHYNSPQPARLDAHAFTKGTDIHIAPGAEKHLPHEAWHVVQQKQGRVRATRQWGGSVGVNEDVGLEREADFMGGKASPPMRSLNLSDRHLFKRNDYNGNKFLQFRSKIKKKVSKNGEIPESDLLISFILGAHKWINIPFLKAVNMIHNYVILEHHSYDKFEKYSRNKQWIASYWSKVMGSASAPVYSDWVKPISSLQSARSAYRGKKYRAAKTNFIKSVHQYNEVHKKWISYRKKIGKGASHAITTIKVTNMVLSTVLSAGTATVIGSALTSAGTTFVESTASNYGSKKYGIAKRMDWKKIGLDTTVSFAASWGLGRIGSKLGKIGGKVLKRMGRKILNNQTVKKIFEKYLKKGHLKIFIEKIRKIIGKKIKNRVKKFLKSKYANSLVEKYKNNKQLNRMIGRWVRKGMKGKEKLVGYKTLKEYIADVVEKYPKRFPEAKFGSLHFKVGLGQMGKGKNLEKFYKGIREYGFFLNKGQKLYLKSDYKSYLRKKYKELLIKQYKDSLRRYYKQYLERKLKSYIVNLLASGTATGVSAWAQKKLK